MPTLSHFKERVFKIGKWVAIALAAILILFIIFKILFAIKEAIWPTKPPPPTVSFGKLTPFSFPEGVERKISYSVDTLSGDLPAFSDRAKVYKMATYEPDLLAVEKANGKVRSLGLEIGPQQISETIYSWRSPPPLDQELILNVNYPEFFLTSNYATNPAVLSAQNLPSEIEAKQIAKNFSEALSYFPSDIDDKKTAAVLYTLFRGIVNPATSLANTNLVGVYFFQKDRDGLPIVYPDGRSTMNLVIGGGEFEPEVIDARFIYQKIDEKNGTYPIKTSVEAFEELKQGKGYIASVTPEVDEVKIKKVYLAYFIGKKRQDYLYPVIVFEGTGEFLAYISALKDDWFQN